MGRDVTLSLLVARMFFPCMKGEVAGYIEACRTCQTKHGKGADQRHTLRSVPAGYPFQRIHIDLVGPLNKGARTGASNILTVRDTFTKWVEAIPLTATTTLEVARALKREIFSRYGYPETIHFDLGPQFTSQFFLDLGKTLDIQITDTTGYNPKSNGQVERMHRDLGAIIRAALRDNPKASWEDKLPQALFALRTAVCRSTGLAPYQLLFGRDCSTPIDLLFGRPEDDDIDKGGRQHRDYLRRLRMRIDAAQRYARRNMAEAVIRQRRQYHLERKSFRPGIKVWLLTPSVKPGTARKLANPWSGPWVVCVDGVNDVMVRILPHPDWSDSQATRVMSIKRPKLYGDGAAVRPPSDDADLDMAGDEYVEHVDNGGAGTPLPPPPEGGGGGRGGGGGGGPVGPGGGAGGGRGAQAPPTTTTTATAAAAAAATGSTTRRIATTLFRRRRGEATAAASRRRGRAAATRRTPRTRPLSDYLSLHQGGRGHAGTTPATAARTPALPATRTARPPGAPRCPTGTTAARKGT